MSLCAFDDFEKLVGCWACMRLFFDILCEGCGCMQASKKTCHLLRAQPNKILILDLQGQITYPLDQPTWPMTNLTAKYQTIVFMAAAVNVQLLGLDLNGNKVLQSEPMDVLLTQMEIALGQATGSNIGPLVTFR